MTTLDSDLDVLTLRSPDSLCSALPHLLGFAPESSAVLIWLAAGRIVVTQRVDLPDGATDLRTWAQAVVTHVGVARSDAVAIVLVLDQAAPTPLDELFPLLRELAASRGIEVLDALTLRADRWRSLLCRDAQCCPPEGRPIDDAVRTRIAAEFAGHGSAPVSSRDEMVRSLDPHPDRVRAVLGTGVLDRRPRHRQRWRDHALRNALSWCAKDDVAASPERAAHLIRGLADVRVRDTLLWHACQAGEAELRRHVARLTLLLTWAPAGHVAPVAVCVGLLAWLLGDGARASVAADHALADDPHHLLAGMLRWALVAGVPPVGWREEITRLGREACWQGEPVSHPPQLPV